MSVPMDSHIINTWMKLALFVEASMMQREERFPRTNWFKNVPILLPNGWLCYSMMILRTIRLQSGLRCVNRTMLAIRCWSRNLVKSLLLMEILH